jgi:hypothetical protein
LDSYIPWLIVGVGFLILLAVLWTRIRVVRKAGAGTKIEYVPPLGYKTFPLAAGPRPTPPQEVRIVG